MFKLKNHKTFIKDFHKLLYNKEILLKSNEDIILVKGENEFGNIILCSLLGEDNEETYIRYFHHILTEKQYNDLTSGDISLREIMEENGMLFVVDYDYSDREIFHSLITIQDIPYHYLPAKNAYLKLKK